MLFMDLLFIHLTPPKKSYSAKFGLGSETRRFTITMYFATTTSAVIWIWVFRYFWALTTFSNTFHRFNLLLRRGYNSRQQCQHVYVLRARFLVHDTWFQILANSWPLSNSLPTHSRCFIPKHLEFVYVIHFWMMGDVISGHFFHISHCGFVMKYTWQIQRSQWAIHVGWVGQFTRWGGAGVLNNIVDFGGPKWHLDS